MNRKPKLEAIIAFMKLHGSYRTFIEIERLTGDSLRRSGTDLEASFGPEQTLRQFVRWST